MSARDPELLSPEEKRASEAVRSLRSPPLDAAYRARLKREFASGALAGTGTRERSAPPPLPFWRRPALAWVALPAAAAAALIVVGALNRGPGWELVSSRGAGEAVVDGVPVPMARAADLARRLKPGVRLQLPTDGEIEIALRGQLAIQVAPGTDVTLPASAGRWFGRSARANVAHGELRITTGAGFQGARLAVETPEAMVEVTGTTLAVICEPTGTCVCVLEGRVRVAGPAEGAGVMVPEGQRRYVFNDARPPETAGIRPNEHVSLQEFRELKRAMMEGGGR
jgi:ferric-dicitrate binding protein FerR (iron transport regulator)